MNVINCRTCGRLFNVLGSERICPACQKALEDKFQEVKQYLDDNPHATVEQTATDTEVSVKQIKQWVREERLMLSSATVAGITCEKCGVPIRTGRFCEKCKANMANELENVYKKPEPPVRKNKIEHEKERMRFLKTE